MEGSGVVNCPVSKYANSMNTVECKICPQGRHTSNFEGSVICSSCGVGKYITVMTATGTGLSISGTCTDCLKGNFQGKNLIHGT